MKSSQARHGVARPALAAGLSLGLCGAAIAGWTAQAPMASAVVAEGRIAVEGDSKAVQHLEGGIVAELLAAEGEAVDAGQPLIRIDISDAEAARAALAAERDLLAAQSLRLRAELADMAAPEFSMLASEDAEGLAAAVAGQTALFEARARERAATREMLAGTLERLGANRAAITAERDGAEEQLALRREAADAARALTERGVASRAALRESESALAAARGTLAVLTAQLAEARAAEAEAQLGAAETETGRIADLSEQLATATGRLAEIAPALAAAEQRIARAELRAPVAGVVVGLAIATVGGVLAPGEAVMRIVPRHAILAAHARVRPADRERLDAGMAAQVRLPGLESRPDASLEGEVLRISADRIEDQRQAEEAPDGHYLVAVRIAGVPSETALAPGMPVTVVIPTRTRTVVDYLLSPLRDAIARSLREV